MIGMRDHHIIKLAVPKGIDYDRQQLLTEVDCIIDILEARIPANVSAPVNQKHVDRLEKGLQDYFKMLGDAFPYDRVFDIYIPFFFEAVGKDFTGADFYLNPLISRFNTRLALTLRDSAIVSYLAGSAQTVFWGKTKVEGIPIAFEGPPISQAVGYAQEHTATLVQGINETTRREIASTISQGIENKRGVDGLARDIRNRFDDMSKRRSLTIARTETNDALSQAFMDRSRDMGIEYKEWIVTHPCPQCEYNAAEGVVPMNHIFNGGVERPPQHPNCRCALAPARKQDEEVQ